MSFREYVEGLIADEGASHLATLEATRAAERALAEAVAAFTDDVATAIDVLRKSGVPTHPLVEVKPGRAGAEIVTATMGDAFSLGGATVHMGVLHAVTTQSVHRSRWTGKQYVLVFAKDARFPRLTALARKVWTTGQTEKVVVLRDVVDIDRFHIARDRYSDSDDPILQVDRAMWVIDQTPIWEREIFSSAREWLTGSTQSVARRHVDTLVAR